MVNVAPPGGELLQRFTYNDAAGWPSAADGDGPSLEYVGPQTGTENLRQRAAVRVVWGSQALQAAPQYG